MRLDGFALEGSFLAGEGGLGAEGLCGGAGCRLGSAALMRGLGEKRLQTLLFRAETGGAEDGLRDGRSRGNGRGLGSGRLGFSCWGGFGCGTFRGGFGG